MQMEWTYVIAVVITGLTVVFLALILLVLFISVMGKFFDKKKQDNSSKPNDDETKVVKPQVPTVVENIVVEDTEEENTIIAVISAAVAMLGFKDGKQYQLKSVKPINSVKTRKRSAWANANAQEKTNPF